MRKQKSWSRKNIEFVCGYCHSCNKELLNTMGGWIINGEKNTFVITEEMEVVSIIIVTIKENKMPGHKRKRSL